MEMNEEQTAQFKAIVKEGFDWWMLKATPEVKAAGVAQQEQYKNDPEFAASEGAKVATAFTEADADANGLLNLAEYEVFIAKMIENDRARGSSVEPCPGIVAKMHAHFIAVSGNPDGVSLEQFFQGMGAWMAEMNELKAAAEA